MHILLLIGYSLLCVYGIIKIPFIRNSGIRPVYLLLFFGLHVLTGLLHNIIAYRYYPEHGDIWNFFSTSFEYRHLLISDFPQFLADNSTLTFFTHNGIIWIHMVLNIFSFDSMTINTLLFSFPVFLGNIALFRLFLRRFPNAGLAACTVFLLPSTLFWTSCIHREAILYMLLGFLFYSFDRLLTRSSQKHIICLIACLLLILYFRFSILLSLLPALATWLLVEKHRLPRRLPIFTGAALLLLFILASVFPAFFAPLARAIAARQQEFSSLEGHSRLALPVMDGTWTSIWKVLPYAIRNGLFEPLPGSGGQTIYLAFSFELLGIWLIIVIALIRQFYRSRQLPHSLQPVGPLPPNPSGPSSVLSGPLPAPPRPFILCCLIFALSGLLIIGAMIPFAGAIVRYRSFFLPFLVGPALYCLHSAPLIRRFDTWLSLHLLSLPESGESRPSY